jgi:DNA-binding NarL/FixJ family response regulator
MVGMVLEEGARRELLDEVRQVRGAALEHERAARQLARQRRELLQRLVDGGLSQAEIARELGVTRQAIQKMLAL